MHGHLRPIPHESTLLSRDYEHTAGIRRQVVVELGFLGGVNAQRVINQQAQDHASACAFLAGMRGKIIGEVLLALIHPDMLIAPRLRDDLHNVRKRGKALLPALIEILVT
jgi:hypothetical protein